MIEFFKEIGLPPETYEITDTEVRIKGEDFADVFPHENIRSIHEKCSRLRNFEGYADLIAGFRNPSQFSSTVFEVESAIFCLDRYPTNNIRFGIEETVDGKVKHPDFELTTADNLTVIVECKSLVSLNRVRTSRAARILKLVEKEIGEPLPDQWRLEVSFDSLPHHWNRNLGDQLRGGAGELLRQEYTEKGITLRFETGKKVSLKLCKRDDPFFFKGQISAGDEGPKNRPRIVVCEQIDLEKSILNNIKAAATQLPRDKFHMMFLYPVHHRQCESAVKRFLSNQRREKLLAIHSWTKNVTRYWNDAASLPPSTFPLAE